MNDETVKRFWSKVNKLGPIPAHRAELGPCWVWTASKRAKGYGAFVWADEDGKIIQGRAHRFSWELKNGAVPAGLCVLHHCDNPPCANPRHLFLGTKAENNDDMDKKGRRVVGGAKTGPSNCKYRRGLNHHAAKLNEALVREIRNLRQNLSFGQLAKRFGLTVGHTWRIVNRKAWKHVI